MIRSATYRLIKQSTASRRCLASQKPLLRFCTKASSTPPPSGNSFVHHQPPPPQEAPTPPEVEDDGTAHKKRSNRTKTEGGYEEEQTRVLRAALEHVTRLGWSESAMIFGARDVGISPAIVGSFPRREAALVEFFMDDCLQKFIDRIDSKEELKHLMLSDRLAMLIRIRLELQIPYITKWPQALSIQAQPMNLPTSLKQRAVLVDEIWHAAGEEGSDTDWYVKRTVLGGIYSTTELYMLTDNSPEFHDTWNFLEHRIKDAFDLQKTVKEVGYLAEAVGTSMGKSVQGFMKKLFQG
ncbi:hypothetical protein HPP92_012842 [Vanilla planifolia]|uniref:Ubiquinone biosynthesis protein n=1 Tax=Vanilla planifolia TaxID=51239 RepID=A0A835QUI1_VANPL|nr:hypothetical protein HPP92_013279 [Vanilla planifolia]KAG0478123.1 hypothetical protein HPP92_012842 [Vanilla planifolia]